MFQRFSRLRERNRPRDFVLFLVLGTVVLGGLTRAQELPDAPSATKAKMARSLETQRPRSESNWPRTFTAENDTFTIYPPQIDKWEGDLIDLYCAVELKEGKNSAPKYGVVWFQTRTEVDKVNRLVTLSQGQVLRVKFPAAASKELTLKTMLERKLPGAIKTVSLDRLEAALEADYEGMKGVEVNNDPPQVVIAVEPAMLVLVDGTPELREVPGTKLQRVMNTRSILLFDQESKLYYLRLGDLWLQSPALEGAWKYADTLPADVKKAEELLVSQNLAQKAETKQPQQPPSQQASAKDTAKPTKIPAVYVVFGPAELIETKGDPKYERIPGTDLEYATNTNGNLFRLSQEYFILVSGRWFKSAALDGKWAFVAGNDLPPDFTKIPKDNPKATVLASVPGTAESKEAVIANSIPQTATITRSEAKLTVEYDGEPVLVPIEKTSMQYAKNTRAAVIKASNGKYYCVEAGVWFSAASPQGPWGVADSVPDEIYSIPPSSPLYYVTYVRVYGSTPEVVHVGYTPGYYGTVVSASTMTVVYGTGWYYPPYIGPTVWYGWPYTYGVGAGFTYTTDSGWSFGFGYGYTYYPYYYPWWGPMGYYGYYWYPYYGWGAWGGAAAANVYGVWGNTAYSRTGAAWANPYTGNYGAATRGAYHNAATDRSTVAGRGFNTNFYTGNTAGYRGAATYNPNTGIVAGAGSGYAGNIYSGQGAAGRGAFAYNTNTNAGIAAGKNNVFAGKDGTVYRYDRNNGNWSSNSGSGWQSVDRPQPKLQNQQQMRTQGAQRTQNFNSMRSFAGGRMGGGRRR